MTTKILALTDALGNLVRFVLLPGHRFDTVGVAPLIQGLEFGALIADKILCRRSRRPDLVQYDRILKRRIGHGEWAYGEGCAGRRDGDPDGAVQEPQTIGWLRRAHAEPAYERRTKPRAGHQQIGQPASSNSPH
jgi:hypothetical protein